MLDNYYQPWQLQLELNLTQQLARWGHCLLLDCHSFPHEAFAHEDDQGKTRPDICLGSCDNTPEWLLHSCRELFRRRGYTVEMNFPYRGCLVPAPYQHDPRVAAIMIEINRGLYLKPASQSVYRLGNVPVKLGSFDRLRTDIWAIMLQLAQEAECRGVPMGRASWATMGTEEPLC